MPNPSNIQHLIIEVAYYDLTIKPDGALNMFHSGVPVEYHASIYNILVTGRDKKEHDLKKLEAAGVTLNKEKCQFLCTKVVFLGHVIDTNGVSPDPSYSKDEAILNKSHT